MINTNRLDYKKDLEEVIYMFCDGSSVEINHFQKTESGSFYDEFILDGEKYTFTNCYNAKSQIELKRYEKRFSKLGLYKILTKKFNIELPWGALTGIRPTKMAYNSGSNFERDFTEIFSVSNSKTDLIKKILQVQKPIIDEQGVYSDFFVGIPYCPSRCAYCSFMSEEIGKSKNASEYVNVLVKEIEGSIALAKNCRSVYIGGGTPISLNEDCLEKILLSVKPLLNTATEFTVEAGRPDCITESKLQLLKDYGVTRVCVNPQTFHDKTLKIIGRNHSVSQIFEKYELTKEYGFDVNMDLIAGLPNETFEDFKYSIDTAIKLNPENITVHTLCLKKGSKLKEEYSRLSEGEIIKMIDYSHQDLQNAGYNPYYLYRQKYMAGNLENTGYSKPNKECIYNIDVMEEFSSNVACGANSVSKRVFLSENRIERYGAPKDIKTYINKVDEILKCKKELFNS